MRRNKYKLRYKKERVLLSDVLPYELPLIFSDRNYYRFLVQNKVCIEDNKLIWDEKITQGAFEVLRLIFNIPNDLKAKNRFFTFDDSHLKTIPFDYKILHKPEKSRQLTVIHPANQVAVVSFYEKYKSLILYFTNKSKFSIRHPDKVACYFYYRDRLHHELLGQKTDILEMYMNEYENLKTYFSYKKYSNLYKFYEDYRYQRAEKKYSKLRRLDIQSCFDSIYTHSIAWATGNGKDNFKTFFPFPGYKKTFASDFDVLMQNLNYGETNGIVIGPEFSRIFAEIMLQYVDATVEAKMCEKHHICKIQYECYRYVDDYFFFYNDNKVLNDFTTLLDSTLKEFKMNISSQKIEDIERPFLTNISRAKLRVDELIRRNLSKSAYLKNVIEAVDESTDKDIVEEEEPNEQIAERLQSVLDSKNSIFLISRDFNVEFKDILCSTSTNYKDILNYSFVKIGSANDKLLTTFDKDYKVLAFADQTPQVRKKRQSMERMLGKYLINLVDVIFFLYNNNRKVNTTLKSISILNSIIIYLQSDYDIPEKKARFSEDLAAKVLKKIQDEIYLVFQTSKLDENTQLETLYFLLVMKMMGKEYYLDKETLSNYLGENKALNVLSISMLIYYYGNISTWVDKKKELLDIVKKRIADTDERNRRRSSELMIMTLDLVACPFVDNSFKHEILELMMLEESEKRNMIIKYLKGQKYFFTKWNGVNITKELGAKISQEVYS